MKLNVKFIRGGAYKPRTSPYSFQGLGLEGLKIIDAIRKKYNLLAVSEIVDLRDIESGIQYIDIIQIGLRNMHNYSLLKEVGKINHPVLLKRGMMFTVDELLYAAEYIAFNGNENIILCERGIHTFDNSTRCTLDLSCVCIIKNYMSIPVIVDLSHSLGRKDIISLAAKGVLASGADGIMLEVCPNPSAALSDSNQQLDINQFHTFLNSINYINT